jgi:hypothetical protein
VAAQVRSVRLAQIGLVALTCTVGCVRFGYDARRTPIEPDASRTNERDTGVSDAGETDANARDGSIRDSGPIDAAMDAAEGGASDATVKDGAAPMTDAAMQMPMDGASIDDGSMDAAPTDSGDDDRVDLCPERSDALFCDGFETLDFMPKWPYSVTMNGTVDRSTARVRTGSGSLRATTGNAGSTNVAREGTKPFMNQKSGEIWTRTYYYIPSSTMTNSFFSTTVVAEIEPPFFGFALVVFPTQVQIGVGSTMYPGTMAFPHDRWVCLELHVEIDPAVGVFEAYLDSARVVRSPATDTLPTDGYTSLDVGIHYTDTGQGPVEVYVDDVVAGNTRIGCN